MKIKEILKEKNLVYTLFFDHLYVPVILFALFFYCSSYLLGLSGFNCQDFLYDFLCKRKFEEFQKSNLDLTAQIEAFIAISNLFVFIGPVLFLKLISGYEVKKIKLDSETKKNMIKTSLGCFFFILLFLFCIYVTPFSENLWGNFFYYSTFVYYFSTSFIFTVLFSFELILFCYLKLIFQQYGDNN